jgi:hypothetical protein
MLTAIVKRHSNCRPLCPPSDQEPGLQTQTHPWNSPGVRPASAYLSSVGLDLHQRRHPPTQRGVGHVGQLNHDTVDHVTTIILRL